MVDFLRFSWYIRIASEREFIFPVKITPPRLKVIKIMLETSNLARKYTPICSFRKYIF